jgi:hypothetical protein
MLERELVKQGRRDWVCHGPQGIELFFGYASSILYIKQELNSSETSCDKI